MEPRGYQNYVLGELKDYIAAVNASADVDATWKKFWGERGVPVTVAGGGGMRPYSDDIAGVPNACIKVPTGGGKTFIAANAVRTIFEGLPFGKNKFVLWLVPSDAILTQTTLNLQNPDHPYRQKLKYVKTVIAALPSAVRSQLALEFIPNLTQCIVEKIDSLQAAYKKDRFLDKLNKNEILCEAKYQFPETVKPVEAVQLYEKSLYEGEYDMDGDEDALVQKIASLPNVKWWHRIKERVPGLFKINGYRPIYPDFIVRTNKGCVILIEVKGNYLNGTDAKDKMALGKHWEAAAGQNYKYFMVFPKPENEVPNAMNFESFLNTLQCL